MERISRRSFLQGTGAAALAAGVALLTGCSDDSHALGEYKIAAKVTSFTWDTIQTSGSATLEVAVQGVSNGLSGKRYSDVFSASVDGTAVPLKSSVFNLLVVVQGWKTTCTPVFEIKDETLYEKLKLGQTTLDVAVTLSGQTLVLACDLSTGEIVYT